MALTSPQFVLFIVAVVLIFHLSASLIYRRCVLTVANALFLASFVTSAMQLAPLLAFLFVGFLASRTARPDRRWLNAIWIAAIVVLFAWLKKYSFIAVLPPLPFAYLGIGLSYILFRMLQLVIDRSTEAAGEAMSPQRFFDYTCNFLCFISGPIERSGDFIANQEALARPIDEERAYRAIARMILGYIKVMVVSAIANYIFAHASDSLFAGLPSASRITLSGHYMLAVVSYTAYLYFNFAGYMDIVIGIGWLLGQDLPENFDHPFLARNLFEFWARWHMTLSSWFKTYLFNPLLTAMASRVTSAKAMPYFGVLAFFVTFFVMGVWHGSTVVFVIYGLVMGAGVSINKVWQMALTDRLGKKRYRKLGESFAYAALARGLTSAFFAIAVTALWVDFTQMSAIAARLGALGMALALLVLTLAGTLIFPFTEWLGARLVIAKPRLEPWLKGAIGRQIGLGVQILLILAVTSFFHKAPEFVYKAF